MSVVITPVAAGGGTTTTTTQATTTTTQATTTTTQASGDATITIWHDETPDFGFLGTPQRWANVQGQISDSDGVDTVEYRLNDQVWVAMQLGSDVRRLTGNGHFNIDLLLDDLVSGANTLTIRVTDNDASVTTRTLTVRKASPVDTWALPVTVDWSSKSNLTELAQPVDGQWRVIGGRLNNIDDGYDRIMALGDVAWTNYEVEVAITLNSIHANANDAPSYGPGVGFALRWNGHNTTVDADAQPLIGFRPDGASPTPFGAIFFWRDRVGVAPAAFELYDQNNVIRGIEATNVMSVGETFVFKAQVTGSSPTTYRLKAWKSGTPEPAAWTIDYTTIGSPVEPASGSLALIAHEVDANFGDVTVRSLP